MSLSPREKESPSRWVPSLCGCLFLFKSGDVFFEPQQVAKLVDALQQAGLVEWVDRELDRAPVRQLQGLSFEIDSHRGLDAFFRQVKEVLVGFFIDDDREESVIQRIVAENVRKGGADHRLEAPSHQRPGRVFAGRTAAEVVARQKDFCILVLRPVEGEVRVELAVLRVAPAFEQPLDQAVLVRHFEVLGGDDLVRVDVPEGEGDDPGCEF